MSNNIRHAADAQDWAALKRYDLLLRQLLRDDQKVLSHPALAKVIREAKAEHNAACEKLRIATQAIEREMQQARGLQDRAMAYQLTTPRGIVL
ncbi:LafD [Vibrio azureus]|uniref:LafD n=1 Tax=Vibrio azureus TaxID=512649 RepID=UPI0003AA7389|nr:LafD [Vibrio azureus]